MTIADQTTLPEESRLPLKLAGWLALVLGVFALLSPFYAGIAATLLLGGYFVASGILEFFTAFKAQRWTGKLGLVLLAAVSVIAGLFILAHPILGLKTLTIVAIASIFVGGIAKLIWSFSVPAGKWLLALSGILSILIAAMLYMSFPFSAAWALGVLIGVNLIVEGATMLGFASQGA